MTKQNLRDVMACIDYAIEQDKSSNGDIFVLSVHAQADKLQELRAAVDVLYHEQSWVKDFVDSHVQMLEDLENFASIHDEEYIANILELRDNRYINDRDMYYILSRLVLAKQNCDDDLVDCITWLDMMIVEFSSSLAAVCDIPEVSAQDMITSGKLSDDFYNEYITVEFNGQRTHIKNTNDTFSNLITLLKAAE